MNDSVGRIQTAGKSSLLTKLADKVGVVVNPTAPKPSMNIQLESVVMNAAVPTPSVNIQLGSVIPEGFIVLKCDNDFVSLDENVTYIRVNKGICTSEDFDEWDMSEYVKLRELIVGDECFQYVKDLKIVGLNELKKVEIGKQCFCKANGGEFVLKDCEKLESVKIGDGSFVGVMNVVFESECRVVC